MKIPFKRGTEPRVNDKFMIQIPVYVKSLEMNPAAPVDEGLMAEVEFMKPADIVGRRPNMEEQQKYRENIEKFLNH